MPALPRRTSLGKTDEGATGTVLDLDQPEVAVEAGLAADALFNICRRRGRAMIGVNRRPSPASSSTRLCGAGP